MNYKLDNNFMVDIETLGTGTNAVILSIGAVGLSLGGNMVEFNEIIDPNSLPRDKFSIDFDTVRWWMLNSEVARKRICEASYGTPANVALEQFCKWVKRYFDCDKVKVWGNGASFDQPILNNAFRAFGIATPWKFWNERCYRTFKALYPDIKADPRPDDNVVHDALDDARTQFGHLMLLMQAHEHATDTSNL